MGFDVVERMTVLERERTRLERLLAHDDDWNALSQLEAMESSGQVIDEIDPDAFKAVLLTRLRASRIFRARQAIVEAIELLNGFGPLPAAEPIERTEKVAVLPEQVMAQVTSAAVSPPEPLHSEPLPE
jgi:hypothetical protein